MRFCICCDGDAPRPTDVGFHPRSVNIRHTLATLNARNAAFRLPGVPAHEPTWFRPDANRTRRSGDEKDNARHPIQAVR